MEITQPYKEWNFAIYSNMDGHIKYYTKWNKSDKDKHFMISHPCKSKK